MNFSKNTTDAMGRVVSIRARMLHLESAHEDLKTELADAQQHLAEAMESIARQIYEADVELPADLFDGTSFTNDVPF